MATPQHFRPVVLKFHSQGGWERGGVEGSRRVKKGGEEEEEEEEEAEEEKDKEKEREKQSEADK